MNVQFSFGPNRSYFCSAESHFAWSSTSVPPPVVRILQDVRHPQKMATPYDVAFPYEAGSYAMSWRTVRGEDCCESTRLPPHYARLSRFIRSAAANGGHSSRTVFGPNASFFSMSERGYCWQNLPPALEEDLQSCMRLRRPTSLALGMHGAYVVLYSDGTVTFDLRGAYPLVEQLIRNTAEAARKKGIMYVALNPFMQGEFYAVFGDASASWNFPTTWTTDVTTVSREIKPIGAVAPPPPPRPNNTQVTAGGTSVPTQFGGTGPASSTFNPQPTMSPLSAHQSPVPHSVPQPTVAQPPVHQSPYRPPRPASVATNSSFGSHGASPIVASPTPMHAAQPPLPTASPAPSTNSAISAPIQHQHQYSHSHTPSISGLSSGGTPAAPQTTAATTSGANTSIVTPSPVVGHPPAASITPPSLGLEEFPSPQSVQTQEPAPPAYVPIDGIPQSYSPPAADVQGIPSASSNQPLPESAHYPNPMPPHTSNTSPSPPTLHNLIGNPIGSPPMTVAPVLQQVAEPINPVVPNGPENQVPNIVPTAPPPSTSPPPAVVNGGSRPSNPNIIGNISAFAFGKPKLPPVSESPILPAVNGSIPETYTPPPPASAYSPPAPAPATYTPPASDYASSPPTSSHTHSPSFSNNQSYNPYTSPTPLTSDVTNQRPPIQHANSAPVLQYEQPQQYVPPTPQHSYTMPPPQHPSASTPRPPVAPQTPQTPSSPGPLSQLSIPKPKINWKQGVSLGLKAAQGLNKLVNVFEGQPANQPDTTGTLLNLAQVGVNAVGGNNNQTQLQAGGTQAGGTQPGGTQAQQMQNPQNLDMNALYNLIANNSQSNSFGGDQSNQGFDASAIYNLIANSGGTSNDQNQVLVQETETVSVFDNGNGMTFVDTTVVDSWQTT